MAETLDKLYLELSQITSVRTIREIEADAALRTIWYYLERPDEDNITMAKETIDNILRVLDVR